MSNLLDFASSLIYAGQIPASPRSLKSRKKQASGCNWQAQCSPSRARSCKPPGPACMLEGDAVLVWLLDGADVGCCVGRVGPYTEPRRPSSLTTSLPLDRKRSCSKRRAIWCCATAKPRSGLAPKATWRSYVLALQHSGF